MPAARRRTALAVALAAAGALSPAAVADDIFNTGLTQGWFGWVGFDVYVGQSVAVAFTPAQDFSLDRVSVWFMSNDWDNAGRSYTLSVRPDAAIGSGFTHPGNTVVESWNMTTGAVGWEPVLDSADSALHPVLTAGQTYWIVAESSEEGGYDPVWLFSGYDVPTPMGNIDFQSSPEWQCGVTTGSTPATWVEGTPVAVDNCADFNGDGFVDFFDIDAFVACFEGIECPPGKSADFNGDGFIDFFDIDAFTAAFEGGC